MILRALLVVFIGAILIAAIIASIRPQIIDEPEVVGDGAWNPPLDLERLQQQRPRTARIRDMETRRGF